MTTFESKTESISASSKDIFIKLSNLENLQEITEKINDDLLPRKHVSSVSLHPVRVDSFVNAKLILPERYIVYLVLYSTEYLGA